MTAKAKSKIIHYLIEQCKNPSGFIGNSMLVIWNHTFMSMARWGLRNTRLSQDDTILEVGCGGGAFLHYLANKEITNQIYGIDISEKAIQKTEKLNKKFVTRDIVHLSCVSVDSMQFEAGKFNHVFAIQTHIYWDDLEKVLIDIFNFLVAGGEFNLICEKYKIKYHLFKYMDSQLMKEVLICAGFSQVFIYETPKWIQFRAIKN